MKIHQWCLFRNLLVIELIAQKVFNTQCASIATMLPDDADSVCRDIFIGLSMDYGESINRDADKEKVRDKIRNRSRGR